MLQEEGLKITHEEVLTNVRPKYLIFLQNRKEDSYPLAVHIIG